MPLHAGHLSSDGFAVGLFILIFQGVWRGPVVPSNLTGGWSHVQHENTQAARAADLAALLALIARRVRQRLLVIG